MFELGLGKVCFDGLCPKLSARLSSNVWVLVTVRLSKQTQLQGSIKIVCASNIIDAHAYATANNIFNINLDKYFRSPTIQKYDNVHGLEIQRIKDYASNRGVAGCHPMSRPGDRLAYRIPS